MVVTSETVCCGFEDAVVFGLWMLISDSRLPNEYAGFE